MNPRKVPWEKVSKAKVTFWGDLDVKVRGSKSVSCDGIGWHRVRLPRVIRDALWAYVEAARSYSGFTNPFPTGKSKQFTVLLENHTDSRDDEVVKVKARTEEEALYKARRQNNRPNFSATRVL